MFQNFLQRISGLMNVLLHRFQKPPKKVVRKVGRSKAVRGQRSTKHPRRRPPIRAVKKG
jgi:hypothetical protein